MTRTRLWIAAAIVAVAGAAAIGWWLTASHNSAPASDCQIARNMIDYNKSQGRALAAEFNPQQHREASVDDYQQWANRLNADAARIHAPEPAAHAHALADDANKMVDLVTRVRADTSAPADPGAPPWWTQPYEELGKQFHTELAALNHACPA